jgi:hypothetical protein
MSKIGEWMDRLLGIDPRPYRWDVKVAPLIPPPMTRAIALDKRLMDGYEPFAVDGHYVFLRKMVPVE